MMTLCERSMEQEIICIFASLSLRDVDWRNMFEILEKMQID